MRAARIHRYGDPDVLVLDEVEPARCGPKDVRIEVHASSVNPVDFKIRQGVQRGVIRYRLPWTLGLDVAGIVREVGAQVTGFAVGDRVFSSPTHERPGCYADEVVIAASAVAKMPTSLDFAEAASIPLVGLTTWAALVDFARLREGDRVLVQAGSGGVGTFAVQFARALGAHVAATCSTRNVELVASLGAHQVIDYTREAYDEVFESPDVVYDTLGGDHTKRALQMLPRGGRLPSIVAGIPANTKRFGPTLGAVVSVLEMARLILWSRLRYGVRARNILRPSSGEKLAEIAAMVDAGQIRPVIDRTYPLDEIAEAHRYCETGRARGKVVIRVR